VDESLIRVIHEVFPVGTPPPRPVTTHECLECDEVDRLLGGRVWSDVASNFPRYCHDSFPLLTPAAQIYYLPAYLVHAIREPCWMSGHSAACAFERGDMPREGFTSDQRTVVLRWIEVYYRDADPEGRPPDDVITYWQDAETT
jgi:hypothetical protein